MMDTTPDPLLMDVLCDPRTIRYEDIPLTRTVLFLRAGVLYSFTFDEMAAAAAALWRRMERTCW